MGCTFREEAEMASLTIDRSNHVGSTCLEMRSEAVFLVAVLGLGSLEALVLEVRVKLGECAGPIRTLVPCVLGVHQDADHGRKGWRHQVGEDQWSGRARQPVPARKVMRTRAGTDRPYDDVSRVAGPVVGAATRMLAKSSADRNIPCTSHNGS